MPAVKVSKAAMLREIATALDEGLPMLNSMTLYADKVWLFCGERDAYVAWIERFGGSPADASEHESESVPDRIFSEWEDESIKIQHHYAKGEA